MTETRRLRALIDKLNRLTRWYPQWNGAPLGWVKATDLNEVTADLSALLSEPQAAQASRIVYVVDGGDYSNYGWDAVYDSLEAAILDNPLPEMRAILGKQCDPTFALSRAGGWMPVTEYQRSPLGEWWNGFNSDFGKSIHAVELQGAAPPVLPDPPEGKDA